MRYRLLSYVVGAIAVAFLAIAGFAAFSDPDPEPDQVRVEAQQASLGHTTGAYAGLAFAVLGAAATEDDTVAAETAPAEEDEPANEGTFVSEEDEPAPGTIVSPTTGWLSEVEVRALVSLYFEPQDVNRAVRVAWCESRFDPDSVDRRTGAIGLFHHLPRYWAERSAAAGFPGAEPSDPEASTAAAAWAIYEGGGWDVFTCRG